ncbi:thiamine pyrophosphate-binding protein [Leucobacter sp. OLTLW20]|uniref:thiamine pyrophosphate-binding protein n=1 Tax=Leucobacter sp. OLTLW20 TaxID=1914916 RepID=UPI000C18767A|nr:thiamine pyrophosphate-binding protein [Leucobacter sp. OLTLW20]PII86864.1 hypothetical protein BMH26_11140 [Leucobacter sp. OLTLW20]
MSQIDLATPTVSAALAGALARHTAQGFARIARVNTTLVTDLEQHGIGVTLVGHEVATIASADAFARATGTLAVAVTTTGPGFTNALTALAETTRARVPLIVLAADAPTTGNRPWDVDQEMLAAALGVRTLTVTADNIDAIVDRAVDSALRTRRPVVLSVAIDIIGAPASLTDSRGIDLSDPAVIRSLSAATLPSASAPRPVAIPHPPTGVNPVERTSAVQALTVAMRPVIIAGRGAWLSGAATELGLMADALGAITATTALARGIFPAAHFDVGVVGGLGQDAAMQLISEADAVLVVGASLNSFTTAGGTLFGPHTTLVRIDVDDVPAPEADHEIVQHRLRGDATTVLRELRETLALSRPASSGWRERVPGLEPGGALRVRDAGFAEHPLGICADGLLDPRSVAARLAELLPADRYVATDGGSAIAWSGRYWPVASPARSIMVGSAFRAIGLGCASIAGVDAAAPDSTAVLSTGSDPGLQALDDVETAIRTARRCVIVVWNDGSSAADFAALAHALGAQGVSVTELAHLDALAEWSAAGGTGTILLDCRVSPTVPSYVPRTR